jgi:hypothetical protein
LLAAAATAALVGLAAASCSTHPVITNGSVTGCYRAIPTARAAVHSSRASVVGVHRVAADALKGTLPPAAQMVLTGDNDTSVCAVAFKGSFRPGEVALANPGEKGRYALVLVTSRHLRLLASVVLDRLPHSLGKRTI